MRGHTDHDNCWFHWLVTVHGRLRIALLAWREMVEEL